MEISCFNVLKKLSEYFPEYPPCKFLKCTYLFDSSKRFIHRIYKQMFIIYIFNVYLKILRSNTLALVKNTLFVIKTLPTSLITQVYYNFLKVRLSFEMHHIVYSMSIYQVLSKCMLNCIKCQHLTFKKKPPLFPSKKRANVTRCYVNNKLWEEGMF